MGINRIISTLAVYICAGSLFAQADCGTFGSGVQRGTAWINNLTEASGIAASRRNPGILWTHNDGPGGEVYALGATGAHLATFYLNRNVTDKEDIAVGPGPVSGLSYLYVGDIGGNDGRSQVQILRIPEPLVDSRWSNNPPALGFAGINTFTLTYPDGAYNAETLMVDPVSEDVLIVTKDVSGARVYRANITGLANGSTVRLAFVRALPFANASGGDISADGSVIILRREDFAEVWKRTEGESVSSALSRGGHGSPVIGPPGEENGEGIALLPNGKGYVTISEGENPAIYFFRAECPSPPEIKIPLKDKTVSFRRSVTLRVKANGYPEPHYRWSFNGEILAGQTRNVLILLHAKSDQGGEYSVTALNKHGSATSSATLTVVAR